MCPESIPANKVYIDILLVWFCVAKSIEGESWGFQKSPHSFFLFSLSKSLRDPANNYDIKCILLFKCEVKSQEESLMPVSDGNDGEKALSSEYNRHSLPTVCVYFWVVV